MKAELMTSLLLRENPTFLKVGDEIAKTAIAFVGAFAAVGLLSEFFTSMNFKAVVQRAFIALVAIHFFGNFHREMVQGSFSYANSLISSPKLNPNNHVLKSFTATVTTPDAKTQEGFWAKAGKILFADLPAMLIWLFTQGAMLVLQQLYTLVYHLTYIFMSVAAVLSILPITSSSLAGAIKSSIWCAVMPIVVAVILILIGGLINQDMSEQGGLLKLSNIRSFLELAVVAIMLLMSAGITGKLISGVGISNVAEKVGEMAAMSTMLMPVTKIKAFGNIASQGAMKAGLIGGKFLGNKAQNGAHKSRNLLSNQANLVRDNNNLHPTANDVANNAPKKSKASIPMKDRGVLLADELINRKKNRDARALQKKTAQDLVRHNPTRPDLLASTPLRLHPKKEDIEALKEKGLALPSDASHYVPSQAKRNSKSAKSQVAQFAKDHPAFRKNVLAHDDRYWNSLNNQHREGIRNKYGIDDGMKPAKGYVYFPKDTGLKPVTQKHFEKNLQHYDLALQRYNDKKKEA